MDLLELLQCESCKRNYESFVQLHPSMTEEDQQILKEYTVFMEMRRLKETQNGRSITPFNLPSNSLTLTC